MGVSNHSDSKGYFVLVEAVFVTAPGVEGRCGFFCTLYVEAISDTIAAKSVRPVLASAVQSAGIDCLKGFIFATHYIVRDVWGAEVADDGPSGFSFFKIGFFESLKLAFRHRFFQLTNSEFLLDIHDSQSV